MDEPCGTEWGKSGTKVGQKWDIRGYTLWDRVGQSGTKVGQKWDGVGHKWIHIVGQIVGHKWIHLVGRCWTNVGQRVGQKWDICG